MLYNRIVPPLVFDHGGGEVDMAKTVAFSLIRFGITFMLESVDGQWQVVVDQKDKPKLDMIVHKAESLA